MFSSVNNEKFTLGLKVLCQTNWDRGSARDQQEKDGDLECVLMAVQHLDSSPLVFLIPAFIQISHTGPCYTSRPCDYHSNHTNFKTTKSNVPGFSHNNKPPFSSHLPKYSLYSHLTTTFISLYLPLSPPPIHPPLAQSPCFIITSPRCKSLYLFVAVVVGAQAGFKLVRQPMLVLNSSPSCFYFPNIMNGSFYLPL